MHFGQVRLFGWGRESYRLCTHTSNVVLAVGRMKFGSAVTSDGVILIAGGRVGSFGSSGTAVNDIFTSEDKGRTWKLVLSNPPWEGTVETFSLNHKTTSKP